MNSPIARYVSLVCFAALGAGFVLYVTDPLFSFSFLRAAATFGLISVLADVLSYKSNRESVGSLSFIPVLATAAVAPHWVSAAAVGAAAIAGQVLAKKETLKTIFNGAQQAFAIALAIL